MIPDVGHFRLYSGAHAGIRDIISRIAAGFVLSSDYVDKRRPNIRAQSPSMRYSHRNGMLTCHQWLSIIRLPSSLCRPSHSSGPAHTHSAQFSTHHISSGLGFDDINARHVITQGVSPPEARLTLWLRYSPFCVVDLMLSHD